MTPPRIVLFAGHYGSGKTNVAVNYSLSLAACGEQVILADLDIVNPYFRTKDSAAELASEGIRLVVSDMANTNVDTPALPAEMYAVTRERHMRAVVDVGGDDRGALALGRLTPEILAEDSYDMLLVLNRYRPLSATCEAVSEIIAEIESAGGIPFTGIVNNSNLGDETTLDDVRDSMSFAYQISEKTGLPLRFTTVKADLYPILKGEIPNLVPLTLQSKIR